MSQHRSLAGATSALTRCSSGNACVQVCCHPQVVVHLLLRLFQHLLFFVLRRQLRAMRSSSCCQRRQPGNNGGHQYLHLELHSGILRYPSHSHLLVHNSKRRAAVEHGCHLLYRLFRSCHSHQRRCHTPISRHVAGGVQQWLRQQFHQPRGSNSSVQHHVWCTEQ